MVIQLGRVLKELSMIIGATVKVISLQPAQITGRDSRKINCYSAFGRRGRPDYDLITKVVGNHPDRFTRSEVDIIDM